MEKLFFGTAGIPLSTEDRDSSAGIRRVKELGLGCMELEFVRGVRMSLEKAKEVKRTAEQEGIILSAHAPYYVNLNSQEPEKISASIKRIYDTARIAHACGGYSICFHAGYYMKKESDEVYSMIRSGVKKVMGMLEQDIWIRPETTGKATQWGDMSEVLQLSKEVKGVMPCIDFSHLHARSAGKYNTLAEFREVLEQVKDSLGREGLENMHIHISGIAYGEKGERNHLRLEDSDMNYKDLLKALKEYDCKGIVICESPNIEEDALLLKKTYEIL